MDMRNQLAGFTPSPALPNPLLLGSRSGLASEVSDTEAGSGPKAAAPHASPVEATDCPNLCRPGYVVIHEANFVKANLACERLLKRVRFLSGLAMAFMSLLLPALAAGQASFVQANSSPNVFIYTSSVDVPFTATQTAGNLNVVVVGWSDTSSTVAVVADS